MRLRRHRSMMKSPLLLASLAAVGLIGVAFAVADAQTPSTPPKASAKAPTAKATAPAGATQVAAVTPDSQPVAHAKSAAISTCVPAISELSRLTLDAPYSAMSTWNKVDANDHLFSSIVGLKYDNAVAPRAIAIVAAAPNPKHACDGEAVQVQPSNLSCEAIQKNLTNASLKAQDLNGVTLIQGDGSMRFALLPTAGNGCAVVAIGTYFAK